MLRQVGKVVAVLVAVVLLSVTVFELNAEARAGGGRSGGSRGSRSYSKPANPSPQQSPSRQQVAPPSPNQQQAGGSFMRSMAGGIMGGMLGSMLFSGLAGASDGLGGLGGSGFGLFEILLLAGGGYFLFRYLSRRRSLATATGPSGSSREAFYSIAGGQGSQAAVQDEVETGLEHIRRMDPDFDASRFKDAAMDSFFKIQGAWMNRDLTSAAELLTEEMRQVLQADLDRLLQDKQINKLDNIAVRKVEIVEAGQELGRDSITASIYANLLDYTTDELSGAVVAGSNTDPVKFQEFWTFTRNIGSNTWQLAAIQQQ